jgi:ribosome modulation factor
MINIDKFFAWYMGFVVAVGFLCVLIICLAPNPDEKRRIRNEERGRAAYEAGVPANANPYQGTYTATSAQWLDGWIAASKEKGK